MKVHYYIEINGKPKGPFTIEELKELTITEESVVWKEGLPNWVKATEIEEINKLIKIPVKSNKIIPPPLPVNPINVKQTQHINRIEIIKTILRLNRKWVLGIILLTVVSYALIAYLEGGFQALLLYNKYTELVKSPNEMARNYSLSEDKQFAEERKYETVAKGSPLDSFIHKMTDSGNHEASKTTKGFASSPDTTARGSVPAPVITERDLTEYRVYIDNPDPTDPTLDNKMIYALSDKINNSFGLPTIFESIGIFVASILILIINSRLWKS